MTIVKERAIKITEYVKANEGVSLDKLLIDLNISFDQFRKSRKYNTAEVVSIRKKNRPLTFEIFRPKVEVIKPEPTKQTIWRANYYATVEKPRNEELRFARLEKRAPRLVIFPKQPRPPKPLNIRAIQFEARTKPLPTHPPIRTTWLPVAAWEMAA